MLIDILVVQVAYLTAFFVRAASTPLDYIDSFGMTAAATFIVVSILFVSGVYRRLWSMTSGYGVSLLIKAVLIATVIIVPLDIAPIQHPLPISIVLLGNLLALFGFVATRFRSRLLTGFSWRWRAVMNYEFPKSVTRVVIVGASNPAQELAIQLKHHPHNNEHIYVVVGFIDQKPEMHGLYIEGSPVLGGYADIPRLAEDYAIDLIVVAMNKVSGAEFRQLLSYCERTTARIKIAPDVVAMMGISTSTTLLRDITPEDLIGRTAITHQKGVDLTPLKDKRVLVTGAAGSIGSELCHQLYTYQVRELILLDNNESSLHDLSVELMAKFPHVKTTSVLTDITVEESLRAMFESYRPQVIFHAAAYKHVPMLERFPDEALRVNVGGTYLLARLACEYKVERFVLISTDKAVNPSSVMGTSKRVCELILHALSQKHNAIYFASVRFGNVLGSRGSVVPTFNQQIDNGGPITVTHPNMTRYFMSIAEAANLVIHAACMTTGRDAFILRMGDVVRIVDLAERMIRLRGLRPYKDIDIQFTGVRPGEKLDEQLHSESESLMDTIHPGIMRVEYKLAHFNAESFIKHLDELLRYGLGNNPSQMNMLIQNGREPLQVELSEPSNIKVDPVALPVAVLA